jgi:hypothetical protein
MLCDVMPSIIMFCVVMLSVITRNANSEFYYGRVSLMLNVVLSAVVLSVVVLSVTVLILMTYFL